MSDRKGQSPAITALKPLKQGGEKPLQHMERSRNSQGRPAQPNPSKQLRAKVIRTAVAPTPKAAALGDFLLTAYCITPEATGKRITAPDYGITFSGTKATVGRTIAVDPKIIPIGSKVVIEGIGERIAEDIGGAVKGHHIDVLLTSDAAAMQFGVKRHVKVYLELPDSRDKR